MITNKTNSLKIEPTENSHKFLSSVRVLKKKRSNIVKCLSVGNEQFSSLGNVCRKNSTIHVRVKSRNSMKHTSVDENTHRQRCHSVLPFMTQNLVQRMTSTLVEPTMNASAATESTGNQTKVEKSTAKYHEFTNESSIKTWSFKSDPLPYFISKTSLSSNVQNDRFSNNSSKQTNNFNQDFGQTLEPTTKKKQTKKRKYCGGGYYCCPCSFLRIFLTLIGTIILVTAITAVIMSILMNRKATTMSSSTSIMTTSTSTTSTTITTTTTTAYICNSTCLNQTWHSSTNLISEWLFDGNFNDQKTNYNATSVNNVSFITQGYIQQAVVFTLNSNQMLVAPYMPLSNSSFTVETWLYITVLYNTQDQCIFGLCSANSNFQCLHLTIRRSGSNFYLYLGFYGSDCQGTTPLTLNTWIHVAFIFDMTMMKQLIYLNGILENTCSVSSSLHIDTSTNVTIGYMPLLTPSNAYKYFQGYMDQMIVSTRAKSSCEILEDATLATYFTFDTSLLLIDSGPNSLSATTQSTSTISSGHFTQALTFTGSSSSYFQIDDLTALGISDRSFSISLWIRPVSLSGVLVHVSSNASGLGWCLPFIGFALNGSLVAQILNSNGVISVLGSFDSIPTSTWSHIVQTWSSTNGLRLYIDTILVASRLSLATTYTASTISNYLTLGNSLDGGICSQGQIGTLTPYQGAMDDFRVYSRELSAADVCKLYTS